MDPFITAGQFFFHDLQQRSSLPHGASLQGVDPSITSSIQGLKADTLGPDESPLQLQFIPHRGIAYGGGPVIVASRVQEVEEVEEVDEEEVEEVEELEG